MVPKGWDKLFVSVISEQTGKTIVKSSKASVRNGSCQWTETLSDSIWVSQDEVSKEFEDWLARSNILGETVVNMTNYTDSKSSSAISLPLKAKKMRYFELEKQWQSSRCGTCSKKDCAEVDSSVEVASNFELNSGLEEHRFNDSHELIVSILPLDLSPFVFCLLYIPMDKGLNLLVIDYMILVYRRVAQNLMKCLDEVEEAKTTPRNKCNTAKKLTYVEADDSCLTTNPIDDELSSYSDCENFGRALIRNISVSTKDDSSMISEKEATKYEPSKLEEVLSMWEEDQKVS
ncbi:sporulation-specific protein 15-like isoform X4 [Cucumis melo var. makuwa]|uniref:Sporulation-specific protein 15-like isoform X4 n=1 Tax=Cucumis melo var. makuwa TaxID=1194695 RepID=A0A5A7UBU4_CUCMM|nr:sporulation-specific protein 15-like isoform X4 [Cucumis melo var. makuwa]TYJ97944.1 sporulation-specific protein 15-like isoform X4 [Cucumis melo var. makuwa]